MPARKDRTILRRLLDLTDELGADSGLVLEGPQAEKRALARRQAREKASASLAEISSDGHLHLLVQRYRLRETHLLVLLLLLKQRLTQDDPYVGGRLLLGTLFDSSFAMLDGLKLLSPRSPLLTAGVVVPNLQEAPGGAEILDLRYRISDRAFTLLVRALGSPTGGGRDPMDRPTRAYRSNLNYLVDLRRLALLYQKRAARVFHYDQWDELSVGLPDSLTFLNRLIPRFSRSIKACLDETPKAASFPLVKLQRQRHLSEDECVILITLIFRELLQGNPYLDASDLLKLVCRSEEDLIRKRHILAEEAPLMKHQLVVLEEMILGKELSAEVFVPNAVVDHILGPARHASGRLDIDQSSRREFQQFLKDLDNSEDFFENLDEPTA